MTSPKYGVFAAGDNSYHQIFDIQRVANRFQFCNELEIPYYQIVQIIAWGYSFAILKCDNSIFYINKDSELTQIYPSHQLIRIQFYSNSIIGLDSSGFLVQINLNTKTTKKISSCKLRTFSSSSNIIVGITSDPKNECIIIKENESQSKVIIEDTLAVGCTDTYIFVSTKEDPSLYIYDIESSSLLKMDINERVTSISCSEDISLFVTENGNLYQYSFNDSTSAPIRIYSLPPVIEASSSVQHCAAITYDGRLFTWGYNPSCQLGTGNDRPSKDPVCVIKSSVSLVACGSQNTWVVKKPKKPARPEIMKLSIDEPNHLRKEPNEVVHHLFKSEIFG